MNEPVSTSSRPTSKAPPAEEHRETASVLDHEYDGIREYDNPLPRWWVNIFWASTVFAIGYFFHYHISHNGVSVAGDYESEMEVARAAEAKRALAETVSEASLLKLASDTASVNEGKTLFGQRCAPCHGAQAQGIIGPNLTDEYWIHGGGKPMDIYAVINEGVAAKGMPAWGKQLQPAELRKVAAFITTIRNSNVPGKASEGTRVQ